MSNIFLYAEVQVSVPFPQAPWQAFNPAMKRQPGLLRKTWLSGLETQSVGGLYEFDSEENARAYVENYLASEARGVGGAGSLMTRVYDGRVTAEASREMGSPWQMPLGKNREEGRVYLFGEMHWSKEFASVPWQELNAKLKHQPGLLSKQWLSGVHTKSVNGFYEFANRETALHFCNGLFADECRALGVTANLKLFDADVVADASRDMNSPYYG